MNKNQLLNWIESNTTSDGYIDAEALKNYIGKKEVKSDKNSICKYYVEREEVIFLNPFEQGVLYAKTGEHHTCKTITCGYCSGQRFEPECHCLGNKNLCEVDK